MRFSGWCAYCGSWSLLTKDHVIPRCKGGKDILFVCQTCNFDKNSYDLKTWLNQLPESAAQHIYAKRFITYSKAEITSYRKLQKQSSSLSPFKTVPKFVAPSGDFVMGSSLSRNSIIQDQEKRVHVETKKTKRKLQSTWMISSWGQWPAHWFPSQWQSTNFYRICIITTSSDK